MDSQTPQEPNTKRPPKDKGQALDASILQWRDAFKRRLGDSQSGRLQLPLV